MPRFRTCACASNGTAHSVTSDFRIRRMRLGQEATAVSRLWKQVSRRFTGVQNEPHDRKQSIISTVPVKWTDWHSRACCTATQRSSIMQNSSNLTDVHSTIVVVTFQSQAHIQPNFQSPKRFCWYFSTTSQLNKHLSSAFRDGFFIHLLRQHIVLLYVQQGNPPRHAGVADRLKSVLQIIRMKHYYLAHVLYPPQWMTNNVLLNCNYNQISPRAHGSS